VALWTPADATSVAVVGWWRLRDALGVVAQGADVYDGTDVTRWKDRSGLGNDMPRFPKNDPSDMVYKPNGFGTGLASIRTSGIYYGTGWHGPVAGVPSGKLGAFAALMPSSAQATNGARILSTGNVAFGESGNQDYSSPNAIVLYENGTGGTNLSTYFGPQVGVTTVPNVPLIVGTYHKGGGIQGLALNGVEAGTLTRSYDTAPKNLGIGTNGAYKGAYWLGDHAEYILILGDLSPEERAKFEGYIAWNNGVTLADGHLYKTSPPMVSVGGPVVPIRRRPVSLVF
jgi:hypothetical protein